MFDKKEEILLVRSLSSNLHVMLFHRGYVMRCALETAADVLHSFQQL